MTRRRLTELRIDKVAAVDRPCQEHASADIMKRDFTAEERRQAAASGAALPDGSFPIHNKEDLSNAIHAFGRAKDQAKAKAHIISRAKSLGATDQLPEDWSTSKMESPMLKELAKALGLPETATEADITKVVADNLVKTAELTTQVAELDNLAKMSDKHKAFAENLSGAAKDKFMSMSPDERDAECAKSAPDIEKALRDGDAFRTPEGVVVRKAKVGDELYDVLKSQNDRLAKAAEDLAKAQEREVEADMAKRAVAAGFTAEFGPTLRKAYGGDVKAQAEIEQCIKGLREQVATGALFKSFGRSSPAEGSAEEELMVKVAEVQKANPKLTEAQAYAKAYTDRANSDIVKRLKAEASA